ncbi:MAG: ribosomal protein S18-alanine N-acetyltransferase [Acidobacteriota bacterium]
MTIARATPADLDAIDEIERHSFKTPWPRSQFEGELAREWARIDVARDERGRVVAFCDYWIVVPELHVLVMATHPDYRGRGIAGALLAHVLAEAAGAGCTMATLEVRAGNRPAIALYERAGFRTVHVRGRYYQDDDEDALVMMRGLSF